MRSKRTAGRGVRKRVKKKCEEEEEAKGGVFCSLYSQEGRDTKWTSLYHHLFITLSSGLYSLFLVLSVFHNIFFFHVCVYVLPVHPLFSVIFGGGVVRVCLFFLFFFFCSSVFTIFYFFCVICVFVCLSFSAIFIFFSSYLVFCLSV